MRTMASNVSADNSPGPDFELPAQRWTKARGGAFKTADCRHCGRTCLGYRGRAWLVGRRRGEASHECGIIRPVLVGVPVRPIAMRLEARADPKRSGRVASSGQRLARTRHPSSALRLNRLRTGLMVPNGACGHSPTCRRSHHRNLSEGGPSMRVRVTGVRRLSFDGQLYAQLFVRRFGGKAGCGWGDRIVSAWWRGTALGVALVAAAPLIHPVRADAPLPPPAAVEVLSPRSTCLAVAQLHPARIVVRSFAQPQLRTWSLPFWNSNLMVTDDCEVLGVGYGSLLALDEKDPGTAVMTRAWRMHDRRWLTSRNGWPRSPCCSTRIRRA